MPTINVIKKILVHDWRWQAITDVTVHNLSALHHCLGALIPDSVLSEEQLDGFVGSVATTLSYPPFGYTKVDRVVPLSDTEKLIVRLEFDEVNTSTGPSNLYIVEAAKYIGGQWVNSDVYRANPTGYTDYSVDHFPTIEDAIQSWWSHTQSTLHIENDQKERVWSFTPDGQLGWAWRELLRYNQSHAAKGKEEDNA